MCDPVFIPVFFVTSTAVFGTSNFFLSFYQLRTLSVGTQTIFIRLCATLASSRVALCFALSLALALGSNDKILEIENIENGGQLNNRKDDKDDRQADVTKLCAISLSVCMSVCENCESVRLERERERVNLGIKMLLLSTDDAQEKAGITPAATTEEAAVEQ